MSVARQPLPAEPIDLIIDAITVHLEASFPAITALERERAHDLQLDKALAGLRATLLTPDGVPLPEHT